MSRLMPLLVLVLLANSCSHPQPASIRTGSRPTGSIALTQVLPEPSRDDVLWNPKPIDEASALPSWPGTLNVAAARVMDAMDESDKQILRDAKREDLIEFHQGLGTSIRNEFGLGKGNTKLLLDCRARNADEASMVIMEAVWERLHKR